MSKTSIKLAFILALGAAGCAHAAGAMRVDYIDTDHYADIGVGRDNRENVFRALDGHFNKMAARVPDGMSLRMEILDIDLAGTVEPTLARGRGLRTYDGLRDGPRIKIRFDLKSGDTTVKSGDVDLSNPTYLDNQRPYYLGSNELIYERRLLDDWFNNSISSK